MHKGGIDVWSNLVFIHYWFLLEKLSILSIDTWGENQFFRPLLVQAKFPAVNCESLIPTRGATQQSVDCESPNPTQGAMQQSVDCESLTPTRGATLQSMGVKKKERKWEAKVHSRGSPTKGRKIRSGCHSRAQKRVELLHHPCIVGDPQHWGTKSKVAASPLPSRGPKRGWKCYVTPVFWGLHYIRGGKQKWPVPGSGKKSHSGGP